MTKKTEITILFVISDLLSQVFGAILLLKSHWFLFPIWVILGSIFWYMIFRIFVKVIYDDKF